MVYSHNGILISNKKEQTIDMWMDHQNIIPKTKSYTRLIILYDSIDMKA